MGSVSVATARSLLWQRQKVSWKVSFATRSLHEEQFCLERVAGRHVPTATLRMLGVPSLLCAVAEETLRAMCARLPSPREVYGASAYRDALGAAAPGTHASQPRPSRALREVSGRTRRCECARARRTGAAR